MSTLSHYMITLDCAKKFISKPINNHIDLDILTWIKTYNYKAYSTNTNLVETSTDGSSLSDKYPLLLNSVLKNFTFNNNKKALTLDYGLSENCIKIGFNINFLLITITGAGLTNIASSFIYLLI